MLRFLIGCQITGLTSSACVGDSALKLCLVPQEATGAAITVFLGITRDSSSRAILSIGNVVDRV